MKLSKSQRLSIVLELAEREALRATEAVQLYQTRLSEEQQRLLALQAYYCEYEMAFSERRSGIRASEIAKEREFLIELARMQNQQAKQIASVEQGLNSKLEVWRSCHLKHQALERLIERLVKEEGVVMDKREQRMLDEWFSRIPFQKK